MGCSQMVAGEIKGVQAGGVCVCPGWQESPDRCLARRYGGRQEEVDRLEEKGWYLSCIQGRRGWEEEELSLRGFGEKWGQGG